MVLLARGRLSRLGEVRVRCRVGCITFRKGGHVSFEDCACALRIYKFVRCPFVSRKRFREKTHLTSVGSHSCAAKAMTLCWRVLRMSEEPRSRKVAALGNSLPFYYSPRQTSSELLVDTPFNRRTLRIMFWHAANHYWNRYQEHSSAILQMLDAPIAGVDVPSTGTPLNQCQTHVDIDTCPRRSVDGPWYPRVLHCIYHPLEVRLHIN